MQNENLQELLQLHKNNYPEPNVDIIKKAYELANIAYSDLTRLSGDPWIKHALNTAKEAAKLKMDSTAIASALLHDAYEYQIPKEELEREFNEDLINLLAGLYQLKRMKHKYDVNVEQKEYADYLRRVVVSSSNDIRVIVVRLCKKLDSLRTVNALDEETRSRALKNAFDIYAPLADQIGIYEIKWKIEEVGFKKKEPKKYKIIKDYLKKHPYSKRERRKSLERELEKRVSENGINPIDVFSRLKKTYSFYKKAKRYMKKKSLSEKEAVDEVKDKVAFTILVKTVDECYKVLDTIHSNYDYLEEDLDDYITNPKPNGYKSLQTTVEVGNKDYVEIQIRTEEMHEYNEYGPASHVYYKLYGAKEKVEEDKLKMLQRLLKWRENLLKEDSTNIEDLETEILVFTPHGDVIELPVGSTPIDFAYSIHSELGSKVERVLVDKVQRPLDYELKSGEVVEIKTGKRDGPNANWLNFVETSVAKKQIKKSLNNRS